MNNAEKSTSEAATDAFACTMCGCVCDDLHITVADGRIRQASNACGLAEPWLLSQTLTPTPTRSALPPPRSASEGLAEPELAEVDGQSASLEQAVDRAAQILRSARAPLIFGLTKCGTDGQRAASALADRIGGCIDTPASSLPLLLATQEAGWSTCTLGEVRQRADLIVIWGADPAVTQPRLLERILLSEPAAPARDIHEPAAPARDIHEPAAPARDIHEPAAPARDIHEPAAPARDIHEPAAPARDIHEPAAPARDIHEPAAPARDIHEPAAPARDIHEPAAPARDIHEPAAPARDIHEPAAPARDIHEPAAPARDIHEPAAPARDIHEPAAPARDIHEPAAPARDIHEPAAPARDIHEPPAPARDIHEPAAPARDIHEPAAPARDIHEPAAPARDIHEPAAPARDEIVMDRSRRTVLVVDVLRTASADLADGFLPVQKGRQFETIWTLRGLVRDPPINPSAPHSAECDESTANELARQINKCRFGVVFFGRGLGEEGPRTVEALLRLVSDVNDRTRFYALSLLGTGAGGADNVLAWQTGYPGSVNLAHGYPRCNPGEFSAEKMLENGAVDACLLIGSDAVGQLSNTARANLDRLPTIALDGPGTQSAYRASVRITTAIPGIHTPGTAYRLDGIAMPLKAVLAEGYPRTAAVLQKISDRL